MRAARGKAAAKPAKEEPVKEEPVFTGPLNIVKMPRKIDEQIELTENYELIETPVEMKAVNEGFELFAHQKITVSAMLDMEDKRVLKLTSKDYEGASGAAPIIQSSAMVLSEPFGSGKTNEIIALICLRRVPKAIPNHANSVTIGSDQRKAYGRRRETIKASFKTEITKLHTGENALIRPNLIIVGSAVLRQWDAAIRSVTKLRVLCIENYFGMRKFQDYYRQKANGNTKLNQSFDIVLLKNGTVTGRFDLPNEDPTKAKEYRSMISVMADITSGSCWSRVVYDDFDTIRIPPGSKQLDALFTIYVSATTKAAPPIKAVNIEYESVMDLIRDRSNASLGMILNDASLFTNFNVRCVQKFVEKSAQLTTVQKHMCVYDNPDDNYMRLMGAMGEADANNIMEALNGDAVGEAASMLGIKTTSVGDIFKRMLDKKYEAFLAAKECLAVAENFRDDVIPELEEHEDGKRHTQAELDGYRGQVAKKVLPAPKYTSQPLEQLGDDLAYEYQQLTDQNGLAINRVISNVKGGNCQVCQMPLGGMNAFIVKCCGIIVCDVCGVKGNQIGLRYDYKTKAKTICGSCANCKTVIYPDKGDLIFVDQDLSLQDLITAKGDEEPPFVEEPEKAPEVVAESVKLSPEEDLKKRISEIKNPKIQAILSVVHRIPPKNCQKITTKIKHLLEGISNVPQKPDRKTKVIIFAGFTETLQLVESSLLEFKVPFLRLAGTSKEMNDTVKLFKTGNHKVLTVNSQQICSGLDLQFCSSLIFYHKILDENVEAQVAARGQRVGREDNMDLYFLAYKNEERMVSKK
jgi:hypothetical protein